MVVGEHGVEEKVVVSREEEVVAMAIATSPVGRCCFSCCAGQGHPMLQNARAVIRGSSRQHVHTLLTPRCQGLVFPDMDIIHSESFLAAQNSTLRLGKMDPTVRSAPQK